MIQPKFVIWIELITGDVIKAFTWCRDVESGIERARNEAKTFGYDGVVKVWATPV